MNATERLKDEEPRVLDEILQTSNQEEIVHQNLEDTGGSNQIDQSDQNHQINNKWLQNNNIVYCKELDSLKLIVSA